MDEKRKVFYTRLVEFLEEQNDEMRRMGLIPTIDLLLERIHETKTWKEIERERRAEDDAQLNSGDGEPRNFD